MAECRINLIRYKRSALIEVRQGRFGKGSQVYSKQSAVVSSALLDDAIKFAQDAGLIIYIDDSAVSVHACLGCGECTPVPCPNCSILNWDSLTAK